MQTDGLIFVTVTVNGTAYQRRIEPRLLLSDFLRETLGLTGTHVGCEHGVCGACTITLNGRSARACLTPAAVADGQDVETVEGVAQAETLGAIQQALHEHHGLQCGFCTPGMVMAIKDLLAYHPLETDEEIRSGLSGNLCRCTGYSNIVRAVRALADQRGALK